MLRDQRETVEKREQRERVEVLVAPPPEQEAREEKEPWTLSPSQQQPSPTYSIQNLGERISELA